MEGESCFAAGREVPLIGTSGRAANKIALIVKCFFTVRSIQSEGQINFRLPNQLQSELNLTRRGCSWRQQSGNAISIPTGIEDVLFVRRYRHSKVRAIQDI